MNFTACDMDFVLRVLAGFELASLNWVERANEWNGHLVGAVSQLQVWDSWGYYALLGRNASGEDRTDLICIAVAIYRQRFCSLLSSSKNVSIFLMRHEQSFAEITGAKISRGAGYDLEVPCVYRLYGPNVYVDKIKELVESFLDDGHHNLYNNDFAQ